MEKTELTTSIIAAAKKHKATPPYPQANRDLRRALAAKLRQPFLNIVSGGISISEISRQTGLNRGTIREIMGPELREIRHSKRGRQTAGSKTARDPRPQACVEDEINRLCQGKCCAFGENAPPDASFICIKYRRYRELRQKANAAAENARNGNGHYKVAKSRNESYNKTMRGEQ